MEKLENTHPSSSQRTKRTEKRETGKGIETRTVIDVTEIAKTGTMNATGTGGTMNGTGTEIEGSGNERGSETEGERGKGREIAIVTDRGSPTLRNPWKR